VVGRVEASEWRAERQLGTSCAEDGCRFAWVVQPSAAFDRHADRSHTQPIGCSTDRFITMSDDQLNLTFAALADPTRRAILARLADGEATVNELAEPFSISLQAISKHLKVLERAGLITRGRDAQWRPCRLETAPLETASDWIRRYREIQRDRFDRLDQEIQAIQRKRKG